ncbi:MAG TPA: hypothetical protein VIM71_08245 [Lacunisphaera sp.]
MTVFLLIVVFTMLAFLLVSLPSKKAGTGGTADTDYLPGVMSGTAETSGDHAHHSGDGGHHGDAGGLSSHCDGGGHSGH